MVFDEFLHECLRSPTIHPGTTLTMNPHQADKNHWHPACGAPETRHPMNGWVCFYGAIFNDGEFIYRIGEYVPDVNSWWARWPD
jgi:hypothetical protein